MLEGYTRVKECPICGKARCLVKDNGEIVACWRASEGAFKQGLSGMYLHRLDGNTKPKGSPVNNEPKPPVDFEYWHKWSVVARRKYVDADMRLGKTLGLSEKSLARLDVGVLNRRDLEEMKTACKGKYAYTFPMRNEHGRVIGMRLRATDGFKWSVTGSRNGMFIPDGRPVPVPTLTLVEGPTDTAAALDMGMFAIGRPMNVGLTELIVKTVKNFRPVRLRIITDRDAVDSAASTATAMGAAEVCAALPSIITEHEFPPEYHKDLRDALRAGVTV